MKFWSTKMRSLLAAFAVLALAATSCGGSASDASVESVAPAQAEQAQAPTADQDVAEETPAEPSLVAATVSGSQIDFGSLEGQDVVLWFWAPW